MAMEISNAYSSYGNSYANTTDNKKKTTEKHSLTDESGVIKEVAEEGNTTRKTAADELSYLSEKYSDFTFVAVDYQQGMRYGTMATTNIAISPQFLKKIAGEIGRSRQGAV